ncbi:hypothetical protein Y5S_01930 [Alcanivorax nanhaiticus]|uniref:DUF4397 domain-containing protein n=2 Tax=Alcanivorax nanhaiticus TaxID=1177154 RepID=A0A095SKB2_9GAMM|nr:hypothetical protein Y5S_01930 [Alcanivorax nanhaiticus]
MRGWGMLVVISSVVLTGCGGSDDDDSDDLFRERTGIYFHNQLTDYSGSGTEDTDTRVDVIIRNNLSDPLFEDHQYSTTQQGGMAFKLDSDTETVLFDVNTDVTTVVDDKGLTLAAGANYTLVLMGKLAGAGEQIPNLKSFRQVAVSVPSNQVRVRFIHALSDQSGQTISIALKGSSVANNLPYGAVSSYVTGTPVVATQLDAEVKVGAAAAITRSCDIELGKSYDAIITHPAPDSTGVALFCQQVASS